MTVRQRDATVGLPCVECDGEGWIEYTPMAGMMHDFPAECAACNGTGRLPPMTAATWFPSWFPSWLTRRYLINPTRYEGEEE